MSELFEIKKRLFLEEKVGEVLEKLECWGTDTEQNGKLYVAGLPDGDNKRSVQVKNNENLTSHIRSKGIDGDIYDIISYIKFNAETEEERKNKLTRSKYWLCQELGYYEYIDEFYKETSDRKEKMTIYHTWLQKLRKQRDKRDYNLKNTPYPKEILNEFGTIPYKNWYEEGLSLQTQKHFGVGIDVKSERVTFPIFSCKGELIGVKGRYCGKDKKIEDSYKYLYLYPCNKSLEFFNFHRALPHIKEKKEVVVVEGGKTTMFLHQWGYKNAISIEGDSLSDYQVQILKELGLEIVFVFAWDKDKDVEFVKQETSKLKGRLKYAIYDKENLLPDKSSPTDRGKETWEKLYKDNKYRLKG